MTQSISKKFKLLLAGIVTTLLIPSSVFAEEGPERGPGEWDAIGYAQSIRIPTNGYATTQTVSSGGGNIKIRISNASPENVYRVWLYEKDDNGYDHVVNYAKYGYGDYEITWDVSGFTDGSDGKAEIFAHIGYGSVEDDVTIQFFD